MNNDVKIDYYLLQLDRALQAMSVSQRAEIITEIKSHIHEALAKDSSRTLQSVLNDLGTPQEVAAPYLASKGLPLTPPKNRPARIFKYMAASIVVFLAVVFFSGLAAVWYMSPLVQIDEEKGRVTLLGGLIDINEEVGKFRVGAFDVKSGIKDGIQSQGSENVREKSVTLVKIPFNTAHLEVITSSEPFLRWSCKGAGSQAPQTEVAAGVLTLNLDQLNLAKCTITLPVGASSEFQGVNGSMIVQDPTDRMNIAITNGKVNIKPSASRVYDFEVSVKNGLQDFFPRSRAKEAVKVKVSVVNGMVKKE